MLKIPRVIRQCIYMSYTRGTAVHVYLPYSYTMYICMFFRKKPFAHYLRVTVISESVNETVYMHSLLHIFSLVLQP